MRKVPSYLLSEVSGKVFIFIGIVCEIIFKADFWLIMVTTGSLLISVGAELRTLKKGK